MFEVIPLNTGGIRRLAQNVLYVLCLEKDEALPSYSVKPVLTSTGRHAKVVCKALGFTGEGEYGEWSWRSSETSSRILRRDDCRAIREGSSGEGGVPTVQRSHVSGMTTRGQTGNGCDLGDLGDDPGQPSGLLEGPVVVEQLAKYQQDQQGQHDAQYVQRMQQRLLVRRHADLCPC